MNKKDEALKMAMETLELEGYNGSFAYQACKEALEQQTQEPFAYAYIRNDNKAGLLVWEKRSYIKDLDETPLYTHPQEWQGLSDEEIDYCETFYAPPMHSDYIKDDNWYNFIKAIEQKLKEKNT